MFVQKYICAIVSKMLIKIMLINSKWLSLKGDGQTYMRNGQVLIKNK